MNNHQQMALKKETLRIWPGERQLLPQGPEGNSVLLCCVMGKGYLRLMSQPERQILRQGDQLLIKSGEIATISGIKKMIIEIEQEPAGFRCS